MPGKLAPVFAERASEWDKTRSYCWDNIPLLVDAGLMGHDTAKNNTAAKALHFHDCVLVIEEIAKACTLTARIVVEANMGGISAIMAYGF